MITQKQFKNLGWELNSQTDNGDLYTHESSEYLVEYYLLYSGHVSDLYMSINGEKHYGYYGELHTVAQLKQLMKMLNIGLIRNF